MTAKVAVDIEAGDKTAKGVASAEKRLGRLPKKAGEVEKAFNRAGASSSRFATSGLAPLARTLGTVEKATARALGGSDVIGQAIGRFGALGEVTGAVSKGFGETASSAGVLGGALGALGVVGAATVGVLAAAGVAAYKTAEGWAANVAGLGRLSQTLGIATKDLQEFQQAGERAGVSKEATTGSLAGLAGTLHDAAYGRNMEAAAALARVGVTLKKDKNGQYDYRQGALDVSDALARQ
ncbi:MAG: hypothetical protein JO290_01375, partial [Sphingomonadaceae bacterium]|nr:hypothetical protein [Sphingomonadaceae bacterium]